MKRKKRDPFSPPTTITDQEFRALANEFSPTRLSGQRDRAAAWVMWQAGLRVSEVTELRPADLTNDPFGYVLTVRGKGSKERHVSIGNDLADVVLEWRSKIDSSDKFLFPVLQGKRTGQRLSRRHVHRVIARASSRANIIKIHADGTEGPISPHVLRHTYATTMLVQGSGLRDLMYLLGHSHLSTTARYVHANRRTQAANAKTIWDDRSHVNSQVAESDKRSLTRKISARLGEDADPADRVAIAALAAAVGELGLDGTLEILLARSESVPQPDVLAQSVGRP